MRNPEECIGQTKLQNCGLDAECIAFRNVHDADFIFRENGDIAEHKKYSDFEKGKIGSKIQRSKIYEQKVRAKYVGQKKTTPTGYTAIIIDLLGKRGDKTYWVLIEWLDDHTRREIDLGSWRNNTFTKNEEDKS